MAEKGTRITPEEVILFNQLYRKLGTYAAVARATGRSPKSVKKYVVMDDSYKAVAIAMHQLTQAQKPPQAAEEPKAKKRKKKK